jgi:hypothetical protein
LTWKKLTCSLFEVGQGEGGFISQYEFLAICLSLLTLNTLVRYCFHFVFGGSIFCVNAVSGVCEASTGVCLNLFPDTQYAFGKA